MSESTQSAPKSKKTVKIVAAVLGGLVVLLGVLYGVGFALAGGGVPTGTTVNGVAIGGMTNEQAAAKLQAELGPRLSAQLTVTGEGKSATLDPSRSGLSADYAATVAKAGGRSWNPVDIWRALFGSKTVDLVVNTDDAALTSAVTAMEPTFAAEPKSASIAYEGTKVVRTAAINGAKLRVDDTAAAIKDAWTAHQTSVDAKLDLSEPAITTAAADAVVTSYAQPAVSAPVVAKTDKGDVTITPAMIAAATTFTASGTQLVGSTDAAALLEAMQPAIAALKLPAAKDATWTFTGGKPTVVPSVDGLSLDAATVEKTIVPAVVATERTVTVPLVKAEPKLTTAAAEKLGIKEVTGEFTTYFPDTAYRNNNLPRAAAAINGTVILPGETFSMNKVVGERTAARGYMKGGAIGPGNKIIEQYGGGVSQVATTTYNAFFFSGLKHITHQPHTLYFNRYPAGREATIDWGRIDVSFYNDSPYAVYVQGIGVPGRNGNNGSVTIRVWSTKEFDVRSSDLVRSNFTSNKTVESTAADCKPVSGQGGFDVNYKRLWYKNGSLVKSENYFWRYGTADTVICKKP